jgi:hypothetical protein
MEIAQPDPETAKLIIGCWQIQDSEYNFQFTKQFVRKFFGFKFYHYKTTQHPLSREYIYTILTVKKYGKSYLCRGIYRNGRPLGFSTSVIQFIGKDWFKVYSQRNPRELYFEAVRIANPYQDSDNTSESD